MSVFTAIDFDCHEQVAFFYDKKTGLNAIIAIHNTSRGPALGGFRMRVYWDEEQAVKDALRLSRGMTYKSAMANLALGGGKCVVIGDPTTDKSPALLHSIGKAVERLGGYFVIGQDVGICGEDIDLMRQNTAYLVGGSIGCGDSALFTAIGLCESLRTAAPYHLHQPSLQGINVAVQGLGKVGYMLCKLLAEQGAELIVTDINPNAVARAMKEFKAQVVEPDAIYDVNMDVFSPCSVGAILNNHTIPRLKCKIVAGCANNQLDTPLNGKSLADRNILYAPDYVVNAGGVINGFYDGPAYSSEVSMQHVKKIPETLLEVFSMAQARQIPTNEAADLIAEGRFNKEAGFTRI